MASFPWPCERVLASSFPVVLLASLVALPSCGGGGGGSSATNPQSGLVREKPDGSLFLFDPHQHGSARAPRLAESAWGRLVNVHDSTGGAVSAAPVLREHVIRPDLVSDALDFALESDARGRVRLVIRHARGSQAFADALERASELPTLAVAHDDGGSAPPFPFGARDAALVLRFDDLLDDDAEARTGLAEATRVLVGSGTRVRHPSRVFFDAHHGDLLGAEFHSTRVVVDVTVTADEPPAPDPLPLDPVGLPASPLGARLPNVSLRIATRADFGSGVFSVVRNLRGRALDPNGNGPSDLDAPTLDVVRALRSGNAEDPFQGFLPDQAAPALVGRWRVRVRTAQPEPGVAGGFVLGLAFETSCRKALAPGEQIESAVGFLEVTRASAAPDGDGVIAAVHARIGGPRVPSSGELLGFAHLWSTLAASPTLAPACFVEVLGARSPEPGAPIPSEARFRLRFSEPMDPDSLDALETFMLHDGSGANATGTVVSGVSAGPDGASFDLVPLVPLAHASGEAERYVLELASAARQATDLAGNELRDELAPIAFTLDPEAEASASGGLVLRFDRADEYRQELPPRVVPAPLRTPDGTVEGEHAPDTRPGALLSEGPDYRGAFTLDLARGLMRPRPVGRQSWPIEGSSGATTSMLALPFGVREPLVALGSRLQTLWRHADVGWSVIDESRYDLDVTGLAWAPFQGAVLSDFIELFEVRLAHSLRLPDEMAAASGLLDAPSRFGDNALEPGGTRAVSLRERGYRIDPTDRFRASSGTVLLPFPFEHGLAPFTWRDTSIQTLGGAGGRGIPLAIEATASLPAGSVARAGEVPSFGLPLLIELFTFPSAGTLGNNLLQMAVPAVAAPAVPPKLRVHSTGGVDLTGRSVPVDPEQAFVPSGGYSTSSVPQGQPTPSADSLFTFGQLDTVTRIARVHTIWFDSASAAPDYAAFELLPRPELQPAGTALRVEFRGAHGFAHTDGAELDARRIDPYGELDTGHVLYPEGRRAWSGDLDALDGLRYFQVRFTFENDVDGAVSPVLDSFGVAFVR
jgi:hypothetical protein